MLIFVVHDKNVFLSINGENMLIGTRETIFYFIVHTAAFFFLEHHKFVYSVRVGF
jgi:hypothetical protein